MKINRLGWLVLLIICCVGSVFAQKKDEKPNFSGKWQFNEKEAREYFMSQGLTAERNSRIYSNCNVKIIIEHNEPELKITKVSVCKEDGNSNNLKTTTSDFTYFTDKRGEINTDSNGEKIESLTNWNSKKIIISRYENDKKIGKKIKVSTREINMSKDKKKISELLYEETVKNSGIEWLISYLRTKFVYDLVN